MVITPIPQTTVLTPPQRVEQQRDYARRALRQAAARRGLPTDIAWPQDANRVPLPVDGHHWSISHKPGCAGAVIANGPVGIDIEHLQPRRDRGLFDKLATAAEWDHVGREWSAFFRLWTAKEATLKAHGRGIGGFSECCLSTVPDADHLELVYHGEIWRVEHYRTHDHIASVTVTGSDIDWHVEAL